jgi:diguanylate cyclase
VGEFIVLKDFLANAAILIAFVSICYQIFRDRGLNPSLPKNHRILSGVVLGFLGVSLMIYGIHLPYNIIIDLRNLAVILSAISGGWLSAAITTVIICIFRILLYGVNTTSITAIILLLIIAFISCIIAASKIKYQHKWLFSVGISELATCIALGMLIKDINLRKTIIMLYFFATSIMALLFYYYVVYIEDLTESFRRYKLEAKRDFLTGLNNVRQFNNLYRDIIDNAIARHEMVSLLFIDIDFFKKINDSYGHQAGDLVLKKLGEILIKTCRSIDIVSRNGGEEFSVILIDCPPSIAIEIAERIRNAVEAASIELTDTDKINVTVSIGISSYPNPINNYEHLIEKADEALYEAKETGRNKVVLYK